jgi:hypothetical protein
MSMPTTDCSMSAAATKALHGHRCIACGEFIVGEEPVINYDMALPGGLSHQRCEPTLARYAHELDRLAPAAPFD